MELRKDPITRSWVITGDDPGDAAPNLQGPCRLRDGAAGHRVFPRYSGNCVVRAIRGSSKAAVPHRGEPGRRGDGLYDRMYSVGAHEVLLENPNHDRHLWNASDGEIGHFLPWLPNGFTI